MGIIRCSAARGVPVRAAPRANAGNVTMSVNDRRHPLLAPTDLFVRRHIGPREDEVREMLETIGYDSLDDLIETAVPESIRLDRPLELAPPLSEREALAELQMIASKNRVFRSYLGMGYSGTHTPPVIQRNILENPGWYTAYTPYQAEISQGRLEALMVYQTMIIDLTGLPIANASLLDEATAAAEGMALAQAAAKGDRRKFLVSAGCHPQNVDVVRTRARARWTAWDWATPTSAPSTRPPPGESGLR